MFPSLSNAYGKVAHIVDLRNCGMRKKKLLKEISRKMILSLLAIYRGIEASRVTNQMTAFELV